MPDPTISEIVSLVEQGDTDALEKTLMDASAEFLTQLNAQAAALVEDNVNTLYEQLNDDEIDQASTTTEAPQSELTPQPKPKFMSEKAKSLAQEKLAELEEAQSLQSLLAQIQHLKQTGGIALQPTLHALTQELKTSGSRSKASLFVKTLNASPTNIQQVIATRPASAALQQLEYLRHPNLAPVQQVLAHPQVTPDAVRSSLDSVLHPQPTPGHSKSVADEEEKRSPTAPSPFKTTLER